MRKMKSPGTDTVSVPVRDLIEILLEHQHSEGTKGHVWCHLWSQVAECMPVGRRVTVSL